MPPEPLQVLQARVTIKATPAEFGVMVANYAHEFRVDDGLPSSSSEYFAYPILVNDTWEAYPPPPDKNPVEAKLYAQAGGVMGIVIASKKPGGALITVWAENEDWPPLKDSWEMLLARMKQLDYDPQPVGNAEEIAVPPTAEERDAVLRADSELQSRLVLAVEQTCKRLGWNTEIEYPAPSLVIIQALPPGGDGYVLEIFLDMERRLFGATDPNGYGISQYSPPEVIAFWESLRVELEQTLEKWVKEKGEAEGARIAYLLTGNKDSSQPPQVAIEQSNKPPSRKRGKNKRSEEDDKKRRDQVKKLKGLGRTDEEVAEVLGVSTKTVQRDKKALGL